jgi:hypothetical protein
VSTTTSYRLSGLALIIGSVLSIIYSVSEAFIGGPFPEALAGSVAVIGSLIGFIGSALVLLGLPGVYTRQMKPAGILGLLGFLFVWYVILFQGVLIPFTSVTVVPVIVTDAASRHLLANGPFASFDPFDYVNMMGATFGVLLLAIATWRARVFPRWTAWLLIVTFVLNTASLIPFIPGALGNIALVFGALTFAGLGYALLRSSIRQGVETVSASVPVEARA